MRIRSARLRDVGALLAIEDEAFRTDKLTRRKLAHLLTHGNCALAVAEDRRLVVGYALVLFRRGSRSARIYGLAVRASHRGAGLGQALLRESERLARRAGCGRVSLEVDPRNTGAVSIYRRNGYERIERLGPYYEDGSSADRYAKRLANARR